MTDNNKAKKPEHYVVILEDKIGFSDNAKTISTAMSTISTITGSLAEGYKDLSSSFTVGQKEIAQTYKFDQQIPYLKQIADNTQKTAKMMEEQVKDGKTNTTSQNRQFYIGLGVGIAIAIVSNIIVILIALHF
jgi:hypothetical protein